MKNLIKNPSPRLLKGVAEIMEKHGIRPSQRDARELVGIGESQFVKNTVPLIKYNAMFQSFDIPVMTPRTLADYTIRERKNAEELFKIMGHNIKVHTESRVELQEIIKKEILQPCLDEVIDYIEANKNRDFNYEALIERLNK